MGMLNPMRASASLWYVTTSGSRLPTGNSEFLYLRCYRSESFGRNLDFRLWPPCSQSGHSARPRRTLAQATGKHFWPFAGTGSVRPATR
jgi:hypothetical protein